MWPIHNGCRRQTLVALSSAEAELAGLVIAATEGTGVMSLARRMLGHRLELGDTDKNLFILAGDSTAAIAISRKKVINKRNRHIEVRAMWLQHLIRTPGVSLQKVLGKKNWSDVLDKGR